MRSGQRVNICEERTSKRGLEYDASPIDVGTIPRSVPAATLVRTLAAAAAPTTALFAPNVNDKLGLKAEKQRRL